MTALPPSIVTPGVLWALHVGATRWCTVVGIGAAGGTTRTACFGSWPVSDFDAGDVSLLLNPPREQRCVQCVLALLEYETAGTELAFHVSAIRAALTRAST